MLRNYLIGSPVTPTIVVLREEVLAEVVADTIAAGSRVVISKAGHAGQLTVWQVMDGLVTEYESGGKKRSFIRQPTWAHRVRRLLTETSERKHST